MVFLNLLSRKPKKLDIPPPPPALDIPPPPDDLDLPEMPPLPEEPEPMQLPEEEITEPEPPIEVPETQKQKYPEIPPAKPFVAFRPYKEIEPEETEEPEEPAEEALRSVVKDKRFPSFKKEVFVKADRYREILESVDTIKRKIRSSENTLTRLNEIREIKDKEFERWRILLEDIEKKSIYIDKTFFER